MKVGISYSIRTHLQNQEQLYLNKVLQASMETMPWLFLLFFSKKFKCERSKCVNQGYRKNSFCGLVPVLIDVEGKQGNIKNKAGHRNCGYLVLLSEIK